MDLLHNRMPSGFVQRTFYQKWRDTHYRTDYLKGRQEWNTGNFWVKAV